MIRLYLETCLIVAQLAVALWLYAHHLPQRDEHVWRMALAVAAMAVLAVLATMLGFSFYPVLTDALSLLTAVASFSCVLAVLVAVVCWVYEVSALSALFYASSAYLLQTLAYSLIRLMRLVVTPPGDGWVYNMSDVPIVVVVTVVIYLACWRLVTHHLSGVVVVPRKAAMVFALLVSMMLSMVFDLVLKDMILSLPMHYVVVLSLVDASICAFVLMAEYEILYAQHLRESVAVMERTMDEQRRQFEVSKSTVDTINRRCHDIRHRVLRELAGAGGGKVPREVLADVAREIDVYDTAVRTGNVALDVALTEQSMLARSRGVDVRCMADGSSLDFMNASDVYTLFSGILGIAVSQEERSAVGDEAGVSLGVRADKGLVIAYAEYDAKGDAPKPDLRRLRSLVNRYDGSVDEVDEGAYRRLSVLVPQR